MRTISLASVSVLAAVVLAVPAAAASIMVLGSEGRPCYQAALARDASSNAISTCNAALNSETLPARDRVATYVNRGVVQLYAGHFPQAMADFDRAIALDPSEPESYLNKGTTQLRMGGSTAQAIALFNAALERDTRRPELAFYGRALAYEVSGDVGAAYRDYRKAQEVAPKWTEPQRELTRFRVIRAAG